MPSKIFSSGRSVIVAAVFAMVIGLGLPMFIEDDRAVNSTVHATNKSRTLDIQPYDLFALTNRDRESRGLAPVMLDPVLCQISLAHSKDMAKRDYFDHISPSPDSTTPMDRYLRAFSNRPVYAMIGENLYYRSQTDTIADIAPEAETAFLSSSEHRANILKPDYIKMGIGIYQDRNSGAFWVTEMFLRDAE